MAIKYRLMVFRGGRRAISAGLPDYSEYEAAFDKKRNLSTDDITGIREIDIPTGTTRAQDELVRMVRDVRYRERQLTARHRDRSARLELLEDRLKERMDTLNGLMKDKGEGWQPRDRRYYEFYMLIRGWMLWKDTIRQARRFIVRAHDNLFPEELMPVREEDIDAMVEGKADCEAKIDAFIREYDRAAIIAGQQQSEQNGTK